MGFGDYYQNLIFPVMLNEFGEVSGITLLQLMQLGVFGIDESLHIGKCVGVGEYNFHKNLRTLAIPTSHLFIPTMFRAAGP